MFDADRFLQAELRPRERTIDVPQLASWFGPGEPARWTVRGLTGAELGRAAEASSRGLENVRAFIAAMAANGDPDDKVASIRRMLGVSDEDVPERVSRNIELLTLGSVDPALGPNRRDVAVRLAETFPLVFWALANAIDELTGLGSEPGKSTRSGPIPV